VNAQSAEKEALALPQVGNPLLSQIHDFIDADDVEQPALDPLGIVLRALRGRERRSAAAALVVAVLAAMIALLIVKPVFQSIGMIRVLPKEAKILYADLDDSRLRLYDAFVIAEKQFIQSRPVLDHALYLLKEKRLDIPALPSDASKVASMLDVTNKKGLVSVTTRNGSPLVASAVVNAVLDAYQAHNDQARQEQYRVRERGLSQREQELTQNLVALNEQYLSIGGEHDAGTLAKAHTAKTTQLEVIEERITELDDTITQLQSTGGVGADVGNVEIQRATMLDNALADMIFDRARRLAVIETLRMRYQSIHPELQSAEAELTVLESAIAERRDQITMLGKAGALTSGGARDQSESVSDLQNVRDRLVGRRDSVQSEATEFNSRLVRIRMVAAEQKRVSELLKETKQALDEIRVENQNDLSRSIEIVARGAMAERPVENKAKPAALGGAVFGGLGTLGFVVLLTVVRGRLRFSDDLNRGKQGLLAAVAPDGDDAGGLSQAAQKVRNEIDLDSPGSEIKPLVVGVVNSVPGAGCTSFALELARSFRSAGRSVLLVEADRTGQSLTSRLNASGESGMLNVARGNMSLPEGAVSAVDTGFDFLPLGTDDRVGAEFMQTELTLEEFRGVLAEAGSRNSVVVMDLGTLKAGRQSAIGAALSDRVVLVTAAGARGKKVNGTCELLDRLAPKQYRLMFNRASELDPQLADTDADAVETNKNTWLKTWLSLRQE